MKAVRMEMNGNIEMPREWPAGMSLPAQVECCCLHEMAANGRRCWKSLLYCISSISFFPFLVVS